MNIPKKYVVGFLLSASIHFFLNCSEQTKTVQLLLYSYSDLQKIKTDIKHGSADYEPALHLLRSQADSSLNLGPWSVMDKQLTPPSGDKHDYMSYSPYWWPNPKNPDGPYIHRDGERNPATLTSDKLSLRHLSETVETLALAYFYFDDENYAEHGLKLLRTWFLDESTKMNPHLEFGQAIPNRSPGRSFGIIETRRFIHILDSFQLLTFSKFCTKQDKQGMETWFDGYLDWLLTSDHGKKEIKAGNNHETSCALQVAALAMFLNRQDIARNELEHHFKKRIINMIEPDGSQPKELARTKALSYSLLNIRMMIQLAELARKLNIDLYDYSPEDGRSIKKALEFLMPALEEKEEWTYQQITPLNYQSEQLFYIFRVAGMRLKERRFENLLQKFFSEKLTEQRGQLLWPFRK